MLREGVVYLVDTRLQTLRMPVEDLRHIEVAVLPGLLNRIGQSLMLAIPFRQEKLQPALHDRGLGPKKISQSNFVAVLAVKDDRGIDCRREERSPALRARQQGSY